MRHIILMSMLHQLEYMNAISERPKGSILAIVAMTFAKSKINDSIHPLSYFSKIVHIPYI